LHPDEVEIISESDSDMCSEEENEILQDKAGPPTNQQQEMKLKKKSSINRKDDDNNNSHRSSDHSEPQIGDCRHGFGASVLFTNLQEAFIG
jgi:hypothetical protein